MTEIQRIWWEIGRLQGTIQVLQEQIAELRAERAPIIDHEPARERTGNVVCLPGVTLTTGRRSRQRRRKPETTATLDA
jgi:hypothetical protein